VPLNDRLPSADELEDVRVALYRTLSRTGRAPSADELAEELVLTAELIHNALCTLHDHRDIVLGADGQVVMAHPFATVPLGFSVMGRRTLWWGGCAWDSFAIPHLVPDDPGVLVATTCPNCSAPHAFVVGRDIPPAGAQVAHFLIPTSRIWDDVVHSCAHQRIFCDEVCVNGWLTRTGNPRGYVMDLSTLWRLAQGWYAGRLDRGYQRREPIAASEYFRSVGLGGPFWGLP
jgi:hypothetical protein